MYIYICVKESLRNHTYIYIYIRKSQKSYIYIKESLRNKPIKKKKYVEKIV